MNLDPLRLITTMNVIQRALGLLTRIQALGYKESALRYYRSGDIHQLYGNEVGKDSFGNMCVVFIRAQPKLMGDIEPVDCAIDLQGGVFDYYNFKLAFWPPLRMRFALALHSNILTDSIAATMRP